MSDRSAFSDEEWTLLRVAPSFVAVGVVAADPSGLFAAIRETLAGANEVSAALQDRRDLPLFAALADDRSVPALPDVERLLGAGTKDAQLANFRAESLARVRAAAELLARKGTSVELDAYRALLKRVAERAANAAKEGGFLGIGGVRVSDAERAFIDAVARTAGDVTATGSLR